MDNKKLGKRTMVVHLTWDADELGPTWMNPDNLEILLYSKECTRRELLNAAVMNVHYNSQIEADQ